MSEITTCPKCHREFNGKENMKFHVFGVSSFFYQIKKKRFEPLFKNGDGCKDEVKSNLTVVCPSCGNEFTWNEYKFFGLFRPSIMKAIIIIFFALFMAIPIYIIIRDVF